MVDCQSSFLIRNGVSESMEACSSPSLITLKCPSKVPSCVEKQLSRRDSIKRMQTISVSGTAPRTSRRLVLELMGSNAMLFYSSHAIAAPMPETKGSEVIRTLKFPSGVRIQEFVEGQGPEAQQGDLVEFNYVCRRSNGYFVHSTVDQFTGESSPVALPLQDNQIIQGLKEVLIGMRAGGKRRALIPPSVGYINESLEPIPNEFGHRRRILAHANEPLVFEVQLLKIS